MADMKTVAMNKNDNSEYRKKRRLLEKSAEILFLVLTFGSILSVALICLFIFAGGIPAMAEIGFVEFLFGTEWKPTGSPAQFGIFPMIVGSVLVTAGAVVIGVPIGLLTAIFMSHFCPKRIYKPLKTALNLMAGIPSIVYGFFAMMVIVPIFRGWFGGNGMSMFTAMVLLGIMILPTIIGLSEAALRAVPRNYYEGALALGATHEYSVMTVIAPAAGSGILSSVILGIGRAIGETMAVIMIAGNQPRMPAGIFKGVRTMTANIVMEMSYAAGLHREALIATGAVLFVFILIINLTFNLVSKRGYR